MAGGKFAAKFREFLEKTEEQKLAVVQASIQDIVEEAQRPEAQGGRMPVDTGFLRNSVVTDLNGSRIGEGAGSYALAVAGMQLGDTMRVGWTASYAMRMEYGFVGEDALGRSFNQPGKHFAGNAAAGWEAAIIRNLGRLK